MENIDACVKPRNELPGPTTFLSRAGPARRFLVYFTFLSNFMHLINDKNYQKSIMLEKLYAFQKTYQKQIIIDSRNRK
jgi:hypothetical protein